MGHNYVEFFDNVVHKNYTIAGYSTAKHKIRSHDKSETKILPTWQAMKKRDNIYWNAHLKTLYEKLSLIFVVLAEKNI